MDEDSNTAIIPAARNGHLAIVRLLVDIDAKERFKDSGATKLLCIDAYSGVYSRNCSRLPGRGVPAVSCYTITRTFSGVSAEKRTSAVAS